MSDRSAAQRHRARESKYDLVIAVRSTAATFDPCVASERETNVEGSGRAMNFARDHARWFRRVPLPAVRE